MPGFNSRFYPCGKIGQRLKDWVATVNCHSHRGDGGDGGIGYKRYTGVTSPTKHMFTDQCVLSGERVQ